MPVTEQAAKRYAGAAFQLAARNSDFAAWSAALSRIAGFMSETDHARLLENSRVPLETKHRLVDAGLTDLPRLPLNLAHLLVNKGRTGLAPKIVEQFGALVEDKQGVSRAVVTTAVPISDAERSTLAARLQQSIGSRVEIQTHVQPSIIGGVVV